MMMISPLLGKSVLVTGATGFLGSWLAHALHEAGVKRVFLWVRGDDPEARVAKLREIRPFFHDSWSDEMYVLYNQKLHAHKVDGVFLCAANTNWNIPVEKLNNSPLQFLDSIGMQIPIVHVSAQFVCPLSPCGHHVLHPRSVNHSDSPNYVNHYVRSKAIGEYELEKSRRPVSFVRPHTITGIFHNRKYRGWTTNLTSLNGLFLCYSNGSPKAFPPGTKIPCIASYRALLSPVDIVGDACIAAMCERLVRNDSSLRYYNAVPENAASDITWGELNAAIGRAGDCVYSMEEFIDSGVGGKYRDALMTLGHAGFNNFDPIGNLHELKDVAKTLPICPS